MGSGAPSLCLHLPCVDETKCKRARVKTSARASRYPLWSFLRMQPPLRDCLCGVVVLSSHFSKFFFICMYVRHVPVRAHTQRVGLVVCIFLIAPAYLKCELLLLTRT